MRILWGRAARRIATYALLGAIMAPVLGTVMLFALGIGDIAKWDLKRLGVTLVLTTLTGTPIGALSAPIVGCLFLRNISLGQAVVVTSTGTVGGGLMGMAFWSLARVGGNIGLLFLIGGALIGFVVSAAALWLSPAGRRR